MFHFNNLTNEVTLYLLVAALFIYFGAPVIRNHFQKTGKIIGIVFLAMATFFMIRALGPRVQPKVIGSLAFHYASWPILVIGLIATAWLLVRVLKEKLKIPVGTVGKISNFTAFVIIGLVSITFLIDRVFAEKIRALLNQTPTKTEITQGFYTGLILIALLFILTFFCKFKLKIKLPVIMIPKFKEMQVKTMKSKVNIPWTYSNKVLFFLATLFFAIVVLSYILFKAHVLTLTVFLTFAVVFYLMTLVVAVGLEMRRAAEENHRRPRILRVLAFGFAAALLIEGVLVTLDILSGSDTFTSSGFALVVGVTLVLAIIFGFLALRAKKKEEKGAHPVADEDKQGPVIDVQKDQAES